MIMYLTIALLVLPLALAHQRGPLGQIPVSDSGHSPESIPHLYNGDIKLTPEQKENLERYGNPYGPGTSRAANSQDAMKWPNAVIPYEIDCSIANMESAVTSVKRAMAEWESKTCIRFVKRTTETAYLSFFRGQGCWGHVGHTANYKSQISIGDNCDFHHVMTHEIGHSVGFWHEQSRPDRDNYIQVQWDNVLSGLEDAFAKRKWNTEVVDYGSGYDFASIMHYPFTAFSKNGKPTIKAIADMQGKTPYVALSADDAMQTNAMYKCSVVMKKRMADDFESHFKPAPRIVKRANSCKDKSDRCNSFKGWNYCTLSTHVDSMMYWCPVTCDMCSSDSCFDTSGNCKSWASAGFCTASGHAEVLKRICPHTCGHCGGGTPPTTKPPTQPPQTQPPQTQPPQTQPPQTQPPQTQPPQTQPPQTQAPVTDIPTTLPDCETDAPVTQGTQPPVTQAPTQVPTQAPTQAPQTQAPQTGQPPTSSPSQAVGIKCADKRSNCADWAAKGQCETSGWIFRNCLISCKARCDNAPLQPAGSCVQAMGLGWDKTLPDSAFSASTYLKLGGSWEAPAHSGRLYMEDDQNRRLIGGWCPTARDNQWLKIDLGQEKRLTAIATQGRDVFYEHVEKYELEFSRDGSNWTKYSKVFKGNCDHFTPVLNTFQAQVARYVRVLPLGGQYAWPCMRVELYGCDS